MPASRSRSLPMPLAGPQTLDRTGNMHDSRISAPARGPANDRCLAGSVAMHSPREPIAHSRVGADVASSGPPPSPPARSCVAGWRCGRAAPVCRRRSRRPTPTNRSRWVISRPRLRTSSRSRSNSVGVSWTSSPATATVCDARSTVRSPVVITGSSRSGTDPPHVRLQPRDQLARPERLGHVVVGAGGQRPYLGLLLTDRREDDQRHVGPLAQPAAELDPVDVRQDEVDDSGAGVRNRGDVERLLAGAGGERLVSGIAQDHPERAEDLRLVVADRTWGRPRGALAPPGPALTRASRARRPAATPGSSSPGRAASAPRSCRRWPPRSP